jgi:hypothetical protein
MTFVNHLNTALRGEYEMNQGSSPVMIRRSTTKSSFELTFVRPPDSKKSYLEPSEDGVFATLRYHKGCGSMPPLES